MNIASIKRELLQETNYRCGYCMRNITPRRYHFSETTKDDDYSLLNIFDRAHLIPHSITQDKYKDFYNLIALCKQCHGEIDRGGLNIKELQRLKLYWLVASGRFTRLEIDCLMAIYTKEPWTDHEFGFKKEGIVVSKIPCISTHQYNRFIFLNLIKHNFCNIHISEGGVITGGIDIGKYLYLYTTDEGSHFCQKFHEAYKVL